MSILSPNDDAKAFQPLVDKAIQEAISGLAAQVAPAIGEALKSALDGLTITVTFTKK